MFLYTHVSTTLSVDGLPPPWLKPRLSLENVLSVSSVKGVPLSVHSDKSAENILEAFLFVPFVSYKTTLELSTNSELSK